MTTKKRTPPTRIPLTIEELGRLTATELLRLKLSEVEMSRLREVNKERERERAVRVARIRAEAAPLLAELQAAGLKIQNVSDLISRSERYEAAIPILLKHLLLPYSDVVRETIARSLAVPEPEVRKAWPILVAEYIKAPVGKGIKAPGDTEEFKLSAKDGLAVALSVAATEATMEELIDLAKDRRHGESRILLLLALKKSKSAIAKQAMEELSTDPQLEREIASWRKRK